MINLTSHARKVYSQFGEDGCTLALVQRVDPPKFFVEIGAGGGENSGPAGENNTRILLDHGWEGIWVDAMGEDLKAGVPKNPDLRIIDQHLTVENMAETLGRLPQRVGLLSIDVDGNDYWIWNAACRLMRPWICIIECNTQMPGGYIAEYRPDYVWDHRSQTIGAGVDAMKHLGTLLGYTFVGMASETPQLDSPNAYFVRDDLMERVR